MIKLYLYILQGVYKKVATVTKSGKVTAKGAGVTTVIMKIGTKTYDCKVRVNK